MTSLYLPLENINRFKEFNKELGLFIGDACKVGILRPDSIKNLFPDVWAYPLIDLKFISFFLFDNPIQEDWVVLIIFKTIIKAHELFKSNVDAEHFKKLGKKLKPLIDSFRTVRNIS